MKVHFIDTHVPVCTMMHGGETRSTGTLLTERLYFRFIYARIILVCVTLLFSIVLFGGCASYACDDVSCSCAVSALLRSERSC